MSESYKPHRPTAKRLLNQIGTRYALSNQVLFLFLVPAYGSGLIFESLRLETNLGERFLVATAGYLATVLPIYLARKLYFGRKQTFPAIWILLLFLGAGLARGFTLLEADFITGQYQPGVEYFRLFGAPIFTFVSLTVAAVIASNYQRHRLALTDLADERYRLQIRSAGIRAKVQLQREELLEKIRALLDPAISRIQSSLTDNSSSDAVASIRSTVDDVVRPLSLEVAQASDDLEAEKGKAVIRERAGLPAQILLGEFLLPFWGALISAITIVPIALNLEDPLAALGIISSIFVSMFLILGTLQKLTIKLAAHPVLIGILVPVLYSVSLTPFYWLAPLFEWNASISQINALMIYGLTLGAALFAAQFAQLQRKRTTEKLTAVNQELEILNSSLRQELWLNRRRAASVLHGPVQAALYASAMKLSQTSAPTKQLVSEVEKDIQDALEKLNNPSNLDGEQISQVLNQIVDLWSDAARIEIELSAELESAISKQPLASESLIEICREFITNAIKHGKAKNLSLNVVRIDDNRFFIESFDDGAGFSKVASPGLGSKLLTELSLGWNQSRVGNLTRSYAEVVLGRENIS